MIYGGDTMLAMPIIDLYDKQIMAMSIAAAKDMYEKGALQIKDFNEKYGDFYTPIQKDMEWYAQNVTGKVNNTINLLYEQGIDPLRSAEGRAAVQRLIYQMPVGDIAKLKLSAETAKQYLKTFGDDTNPELERFLGRDLSNWSTLGDPANDVVANGIWGFNKAAKYQTIDDLIEPIVKNVDYTYDEDMTKAHNDGNNYYSITHDRLMRAVNDNMSDIVATPSGAFHWAQAKKIAESRGGDQKMAMDIFKLMIGNRLSDHERVKFEANPFKLDDYRTRNDIRAHAANRATDHKYWKLEHAGDEDKEEYHRIFRRAEKLAGNKDHKFVGALTQYQKDQQYSQWIDPVVQGEQTEVKLDTGEKIPGWIFSGKKLRNTGLVYKLGENGMMYPVKNSNATNGDYTFISGGNMRARYTGKDRYGKDTYKYYVSGYMLTPDNVYMSTGDGDNVMWVEVKERDHNYGLNLRKE